MQCKYNWLLFRFFSAGIYLSLCGLNQNCTLNSCEQIVIIEIMLINVGGRRRSCYAPLKNEDSGTMDDEKNTEVCRITHPYFKIVFSLNNTYFYFSMISWSVINKPSSLPICCLMVKHLKMHCRALRFFPFSSNEYYFF